MLEHVLFFIFGGVAVLSSILLVTRKNVVHCAMFLAATLLAVAGVFLTLHAEFLAAVQVIVYVGGILVLFVFVIMLIAVEREMTERKYNRQWVVALVASAVLIAQFAYVVYNGRDSFALASSAAPAGPGIGNSQAVGFALYQNYLLPFEIASVLLLVAIVGAVALAKKRTVEEGD